MKKKKWNIILISIYKSKYFENTRYSFILINYNEKQYQFEGENAINEFFEFINKLHIENIIFYTYSLKSLIHQIIKYYSKLDEWEVKYLIDEWEIFFFYLKKKKLNKQNENNKIINDLKQKKLLNKKNINLIEQIKKQIDILKKLNSLKIKKEKKTIKFINIEKLIGMPIKEFASKENITINDITYWNDNWEEDEKIFKRTLKTERDKTIEDEKDIIEQKEVSKIHENFYQREIYALIKAKNEGKEIERQNLNIIYSEEEQKILNNYKIKQDQKNNLIMQQEKENEEKLLNKKKNYYKEWFQTINYDEKMINLINQKNDLNDIKIIFPNQIRELLNQNLIKINNLLHLIDHSFSKILINWYYNISISSIAKIIFLNLENKWLTKKNFYNSIKIDEEYRKIFIGGRVEVIANSYETKENIYRYDFKNMYGMMMLEKFPTKLIKLDKNLINTTVLEKIGFSKIKYNSNLEIPFLPWIQIITTIYDEKLKSLIFPNGENLTGWYSHEEIKFGLDNKLITLNEIEETIINIGEEEYILKEFAEKIMELRDNDNKYLWKNILTSFYGKLGMNPICIKNIILNNIEYQDFIKINNNKDNILTEIQINNHYILQVKDKKENVNSKIEYAILIASKARIKIYKNLLKLQEAKGRILYINTDEIYIAFDKEIDISNKKMGDIIWPNKEELHKNYQIKDAVFASNQMYSILKMDDTWETKIAGITRNSIDFKTFKKKFYSRPNRNNNNNEITLIQFNKTKALNFLKDQNYSSKTISFNDSYSKRIFSEDKKKTKPKLIINNEF